MHLSPQMLAIHTFCVLFLRMKPKDWALYATLVGVWVFVGFLVILGPAAVQKANHGPYCESVEFFFWSNMQRSQSSLVGISGDWCWISDPYPAARVGLEYAWVSFVLML